ncbi:MAG: M48 family metalloprotease [Elusimicrobiota bacterium]|nr:M48 family metalloprotease [Endomicrobiia bacterium]MDW8166597.1 M48 family metalloprotease [Elusimicrobiota bacterium]
MNRFFIFFILGGFFILFGCQSTFKEISSKVLEANQEDSKLNIDFNNLNDSYFDIYCSSLFRDKVNLIEYIIYIKKYQDENFMLLFLHQPILPDLLENLIYKEFFEKSLFEKMNILDPKENKKYYDYLQKIQTKIIERIIERISEKNQANSLLSEIKIYIYDDGTKAINAFAVPPRYILISKEIVRKAFMDNEKLKGKKSSRQSKKSIKMKNKIDPTGYSEDLKNFNLNEIFLEFVIGHEISHFLKKHHTLKIQQFIVNSYLNLNKSSLNELKNLILNKPSLELIESKLSQINSNNHRRLYNLMLFLELEADACATKLLLDIYDKDRHIIEYFFDKKFENYFLGDFIQYEIKQNNKFINLSNNIIQFIRNYLTSEIELHLSSSTRKNHILRVINKS